MGVNYHLHFVAGCFTLCGRSLCGCSGKTCQTPRTQFYVLEFRSDLSESVSHTHLNIYKTFVLIKRRHVIWLRQ